MGFKFIIFIFLFSFSFISSDRLSSSGDDERYNAKSTGALSQIFKPEQNVNFTFSQSLITFSADHFMANSENFDNDVQESVFLKDSSLLYCFQYALIKFYSHKSTITYFIGFLGGVG